MKRPLISVIVPVYNVEKYFNRCVDSILNQSYENLEIILVDDSSPDKCPIMCDDYEHLDKRVRVIHQKNAGQSAARNAALDIAKGDFISFIDSDDYVSPYFIEKLYTRIVRDKSDFAVCEYHKVDECGNIINSKEYLQKNIQIDEKEFCILESSPKFYMFCVSLWNKMFRTRTWKHLRLKVGKYAEDSFAMTQYIKGMNNISIIKEPLYYYCQRGNSAVNNYSVKNLDSVEARLERCKYYFEKGYDQQLKGTLLQSMGMLSFSLKELDMSVPENKERYSELKAQYDACYVNAFKPIEPNITWLRCTTFFAFDKLYSTSAKFFHIVRDVAGGK